MLNWFQKISQSFYDDLSKGVDWGDDQENENDNIPWENYLEDNMESEKSESKQPEEQYQSPEHYPVPDSKYNQPVQEQEKTPDGEKLIVKEEFDDPFQLISLAIKNPPHLIKIDYTTIDGRFVEGRIVEPHRIFTARTTGNQILLTWDRSTRGIRGFIINNVKPFGVLYENTFKRKPELMRPRRVKTKIVRPVHKRNKES